MTGIVSVRLDPDEIRANLKTNRIGREIVVYDSTSSTNDVAAAYSRDTNNDGVVIFAEEQTAGRGRGGNNWSGGRRASVLCSIVLTESKLSSELLSLSSAVAVAEAVGNRAKIKWPNDIILNGRKVAGILVESSVSEGRTNYIIGIGINCHQKPGCFAAELRSTATSIDIESQTVCDRSVLAKRLLSSMDYWLSVAEKRGKKVIKRWRKLSMQLGHRVKLIYNGREFSGNCIGVDPSEGLIVQLDNALVRMFDAAHTSIVR